MYAAQSGKVVYAGAATGFGGRADGRAGWIVVDHPAADGAGTTVYGHVVRDIGITVGTRVVAGQRIGIINPDKTTNGGVDPHLHFEVHPYVWKAGSQIDPAVWLAGALSPGSPAAAAVNKLKTKVSAPATTTTTAVTTSKAPTEKARTAVASADDIVKFLTKDNPAALLYRGREEDASGKGEPGYFTHNIKEMLAEIGFSLTTYERAFDLSTEDPDTPPPVTQRAVLGWVRYIAGSVLDTRRRLKRIETKLDALTERSTRR